MLTAHKIIGMVSYAAHTFALRSMALGILFVSGPILLKAPLSQYWNESPSTAHQ